MGTMLDSYLTVSAPFREALQKTMTQVLTQLNMPTRSDVTSLAERLTNIELRLDDLDAKIDALQRGGQTSRAKQKE
jgi:polyhydroxyalkanoate synthesis regulator phasin